MTEALNYIKQQNGWYKATLALFFFASLSRAYISFFFVFAPLFWLFSKGNKQLARLQPATKRLLFAMFAFVLWQLLSFLWSDNTQGELHSFFYYLSWLSIPVLLLTLKNKRTDILLYAFLLGMFISEIVSLGIYFGWWHLKNVSPGFSSPFMIHIEFSVFLAITVFLLISLIFTTKLATTIKALLSLFLLITLTALFISNGRTGQFAFIITLPFFILFAIKPSIKSLLITLILFIVFIISIYFSSSIFRERFVKQTQQSIEQIFHQNNYFTSIGERLGAWKVSYEILKQNPFIGTGFGDYKKVFKETILQKFPNMHRGNFTILNNKHLHNQYLMALVQTGLIGLFLLIMIIVFLFQLPLKNKQLNLFRFGFIICFFAACLAEPLWIKQFAMTLFTCSVIIFTLSSEKCI